MQQPVTPPVKQFEKSPRTIVSSAPKTAAHTAPASTAATGAPVAPMDPAIDPVQLEQVRDAMRREQRLVPAAVAGSIAALAGAVVWAAITVTTEYQIGWMAIGIGVLVGLTVRKVGRGVDASFGVVGAALAFVACLFGNLFAVVGYLAKAVDGSVFQILGELDLAIAQELLAATFSPMDLLFYGLAIFEAYKLSYQRLAPPATLPTA